MDWTLIFWPISLFLLIKGSEMFWKGASSWPRFSWLGGAVVMALSTSLPEIFLSLSALTLNVNEMALANIVGSNVFNILLIVGLLAVYGRKISFCFLGRHLTLLALATILFIGFVWSSPEIISRITSIILIISFFVLALFIPREEKERHKASWYLAPLGGLMVLISSFLLVWVASTTSIITGLSYGVIGATVLALITSLPETTMAWQAIKQNNPFLALRSICISCIFNLLIVVGISGLYRELIIAPEIFNLAIPAMVTAILLFILATISRRLYRWEGFVYISLYIIFIWRMLTI
jgi:cation:H+ antiporter